VLAPPTTTPAVSPKGAASPEAAVSLVIRLEEALPTVLEPIAHVTPLELLQASFAFPGFEVGIQLIGLFSEASGKRIKPYTAE